MVDASDGSISVVSVESTCTIPVLIIVVTVPSAGGSVAPTAR